MGKKGQKNVTYSVNDIFVTKRRLRLVLRIYRQRGLEVDYNESCF
jgi:hypothetical protein